jgi:ketosteroid isomerase-like protein
VLSRFGARPEPRSAGSAVVDRYLQLLSDPEAPLEAFRDVLHPEIRQVEHPNALNPTGQERDLEGLLEDVTKGRSLLAAQRFEVLGHVASGDEVATRARWTGTLTSGPTLSASFAMHFTLRDGRIWRQENFDCFDPLPGSIAGV